MFDFKMSIWHFKSYNVSLRADSTVIAEERKGKKAPFYGNFVFTPPH